MTVPDWLTEGAEVAEWLNSSVYEFTTVKRITATLVVLANGSRFKLGAPLRKVGEKASALGNNTDLRPAAEFRRWLAKWTVSEAADAVSRAAYQVREKDAPAGEALDQMQAAIDVARAKLAANKPSKETDQ